MERDPQYGPRGYLPDRAARRARKIVLREPLGKGWIVASAVAAVVMLVIGVVYLVVQAGPPREPFVSAGPIDEVDPRGADVVAVDGVSVLVVRGAGGVRVFEAPGVEATWCRESQRIESADGQVWTLAGELRGGEGSSLRPLRAEVHRGSLYVDPATMLQAPTPRPAGERVRCARY